jgi:beta-glucuronidase
VLLAAAAAGFAGYTPAHAQVPPVTPPVVTPPPGPDPSAIVSTPSRRTLYKEGPSGRYLVDGPWLFRPDPAGNGDLQGWQRDPATTGWTQTTVPNAWNATDESEASYAGAIGWYRKDFRLPEQASRLMWVIRFESINYRARVWLNGNPIGRHAGAYLPFELRLPASYLKRGGVNRLVIRIDSRRSPSDFPPAKFDARGRALGGWWNYGGILREVYLRRIDEIDFNTVDVRPDLPCSTCAATVSWTVTVRNAGLKPRRVSISGRFGARKVKLGVVVVGPKKFATLRRTLRVPDPRLWQPDRPYLYDASLLSTSTSTRRGKNKIKARQLQSYTRRVGIRQVRVSPDGRLLVNGRPLDVRGVGLQEDSRQRGFAIDNRVRDQQLAWVRELGATLIRAHYPLHPHTLERADELGLLVWSEIPVYQVDTLELEKTEVRDAAVNVLEDSVIANRNHPSILLWSIGNELSARPGPIQASYIARASAAAKALDPTRPVALAFAASPTVGCQTEYRPLDVLGVNDYFGWYPGTNGGIADRELLSPYLDALRACYPKKALMVSEFGAEANRDGPEEERGTFAFQSDFVRYHLGVYATKPWLSGAIYWALQEFRVRPGWDGGNPRAQPPIHQKGVITFDGAKKPAFADLQQSFLATAQFGHVARKRR